MGGMSASSFAARTVANPSTVASASSMMADAVSGLASLGDHVPRRHSLEVHDVVRRGHGEGSQDTEVEGALGLLGDPAT